MALEKTLSAIALASALHGNPEGLNNDFNNSAEVIGNNSKELVSKTTEVASKKQITNAMTQKYLLKLASLISEKSPVNIDTSKLTHFAKLSPKIMNYYFNGNDQVVSDFTPNKSGEIDNRNSEPKIDGNLQYLIGKTGVSSYLSLNEEHKEFIKKLADLLLTDDYAKNIEENKKNKTRNYEVISSKGNKKLKTVRLSSVLQLSINLLQDIQLVRSGVDGRYKRINKLLKRFESKNGYNSNPKIYNLLETLKPEIDGVLSVHKFLDEKRLAQEMDFRKREKVILAEIERIKAEIKKQEGTIKKQEGTIKKQEGTIKKQEGAIKKQEGTIKKLDIYLKTLNKFLDLTGRSE